MKLAYRRRKPTAKKIARERLIDARRGYRRRRQRRRKYPGGVL